MRPTDLRLLATRASLLSLLLSILTVISLSMTPSAQAATLVTSGLLLLKAILTPLSSDYVTVTATKNLVVTRKSGGWQ